MKRLIALLLVLTLPLSASAAVFLPHHRITLHHQQNTASCWAHASVTLAETLSAKVGMPSAFSVEHLIANTKTGGGNPALFWEYALTRRGLLNTDLTPSGLRVLSHAEQNNADLSWVKKQVERFGAVTAQIAYPETTRTALYNPQWVLPNHQIVLVGYDDAYPSENFSPQPPSDGAFLAQNSYGAAANWGGLFWISYHDATLLTQVEVATSLVKDVYTYTPKQEWQTYAVSATELRETATVTVPEGEELRSITLPHSASGTTVTLTLDGQTVQWLQTDEGSYTAYLTPVTGTHAVTLTLHHPNGTLYVPRDGEQNLLLLYGFAPTDAPRERILLSAATPCEVSYQGKRFSGYQIMGQKLIRLRDWAESRGKGVLWDGGTVTLTDTPTPTPVPQPNGNAVALISSANIVGEIPQPLYFIDGYQYLLLH